MPFFRVFEEYKEDNFWIETDMSTLKYIEGEKVAVEDYVNELNEKEVEGIINQIRNSIDYQTKKVETFKKKIDKGETHDNHFNFKKEVENLTKYIKNYEKNLKIVIESKTFIEAIEHHGGSRWNFEEIVFEKVF